LSCLIHHAQCAANGSSVEATMSKMKFAKTVDKAIKAGNFQLD
jgi:hypothetical protein